jgi:hypothetical protein
MNRVLSWPHTPIVRGLLEGLKAERHETVVTDKGMVHFDLFLGPVEMKFSKPEQQLEPGTRVVVWWKGGGFVCASTEEIETEELASREIADRVNQARHAIAEARRERRERLLADVDIVLPGEPEMQPGHATA